MTRIGRVGAPTQIQNELYKTGNQTPAKTHQQVQQRGSDAGDGLAGAQLNDIEPGRNKPANKPADQASLVTQSAAVAPSRAVTSTGITDVVGTNLDVVAKALVTVGLGAAAMYALVSGSYLNKIAEIYQKSDNKAIVQVEQTNTIDDKLYKI